MFKYLMFCIGIILSASAQAVTINNLFITIYTDSAAVMTDATRVALFSYDPASESAPASEDYKSRQSLLEGGAPLTWTPHPSDNTWSTGMAASNFEYSEDLAYVFAIFSEDGSSYIISEVTTPNIYGPSAIWNLNASAWTTGVGSWVNIPSAPEPTSALLGMLGFALVALRRRNQ